MTKAIVFSCAHNKPDVSNERADWLGQLIVDEKPDYVVDLGDTIDLNSLNSYDNKKPSLFSTKSYEKDIEHHIEFQERLRAPLKKRKKKRPRFYGFEGNHEHRLKRVLQETPHLAGGKYGVSFGHLETDKYYDEYHEYHNSAPAIHDYDGVSYAHYFSSGNFGTAMSGMHHAYNLVKERNFSSTCGHSHKRNIYFKDSAHPRPIIGLVAGCYKGGEEHWAGQANNDWWKGVIIKRNIENGVYDPEFVSLSRLKETYG